MRYRSTYLALAVVMVACSRDTSQEHLGTVAVVHSCSEGAAAHLERGLALLHNMTYEEAESAFSRAVEADPECAMGYWGQSMTVIHPLWSDPPSDEAFTRGQGLLEEARARATSDHERAYVEALSGYYAPGRSSSEAPNLRGFEEGWRAFHERYPDDHEGAAFFALAQLGTVDPGDKTFGKQREAGALAEHVLEQVPDHPGAHHYIIHAYDNPVLSSQAGEVARSYSAVAPSVPHALHMPTHTFTRLGLWKESIEWNRRSADAALEHPVDGEKSMHYYHALDYLAYAHLQRADDRKAVDVLGEMRGAMRSYQAHLATAYTLAAVPARIALERQMWDEAAALTPRQPADYPWDDAAPVEAITYFARTIGAARSGRIDQARADFEKLSSLQKQVAAQNPYWGTQVEIQRLSALAWLQWVQGGKGEALSTMRSAAALEATTEKHPVTPGEVLPARELLADMLLEAGRPADALAEYQVALERSPNRFNSVFGAGRAAEVAGRADTATRYYQALLDLTAGAEGGRERLEHAKTYLAEDRSSA